MRQNVRRPTRRTLAIATLAAVAGLALLLLSQLLAYRPLEPGSYSWRPHADSGHGDILKEVDFREVQTRLLGTEDQFRFRPGGHFVLGFSVRNSGRWGVTVTRIPTPSEGPVIGTGVRLGSANNIEGSPPTTDFRPFALGPGDERYVEVRYRMVECGVGPTDDEWATQQGDNLAGWTAQRIDYRVAGLSRHMDIELPEAIIIIHSGQELTPSRCGYRDDRG